MNLMQAINNYFCNAPEEVTLSYVVYLAGQMTGHPQFNFPRFMHVAAELRNRGFVVISPAEIDDPVDAAEAMASPDGQAESTTRSWGQFLARDVELIADEVDGIVLMDEWWMSKGARLEAFVAIQTGKDLYEYWEGEVYPVSSAKQTLDRIISWEQQIGECSK